MSVTVSNPQDGTVTLVSGKRPNITHVTQNNGSANIGSVKEKTTVVSNVLTYSPSTGGGDTAALQEHINSDTPHPAYDTDTASLKLIFENGLI